MWRRGRTRAVAGPLIDVLGHPAEAFSVALPFEHTAHEDFQGPGVQVFQRHAALEEKTGVMPETPRETQAPPPSRGAVCTSQDNR